MEPKLFGDIVVGRIGYSSSDSISVPDCWPIVEDKKLTQFVEKAASYFWRFIDNFSAWQSFGHFLFESTGYDVKSEAPDQQSALEYWWLTGQLNNSKPVHECAIYEDIGIFIHPKDGLLPIFSSSLYAGMASQKYSQAYSIELTPQDIGCLGCFLNGLSGELGRELLRGALLDDQWEIQFYSCLESEFYKNAKHFSLNDADSQYALFRCKEDSDGPIWCEKTWDKDGSLFSPVCKPTEW